MVRVLIKGNSVYAFIPLISKKYYGWFEVILDNAVQEVNDLAEQATKKFDAWNWGWDKNHDQIRIFSGDESLALYEAKFRQVNPLELKF